MLLYFFFFQAEDGIRDGRVTGVQTCALPISSDGPLGVLSGMRPPCPDRCGLDVQRRRGATSQRRSDQSSLAPQQREAVAESLRAFALSDSAAPPSASHSSPPARRGNC